MTGGVSSTPLPAAKPLLVLDLDETLFYATETPLTRSPDFIVEPYAVYLRPFLDEFLTVVSRLYQLAVWTSSSEDYANAVLAEVCPNRQFRFVWARSRCTRRFDPELQDHYWVKDLKKVKRSGFDLRRVIVVDDSANKLERSYGNLVRVTEFLGDPEDDELKILARYLAEVADEPDFRSLEKRGWWTAYRRGE